MTQPQADLLSIVLVPLLVVAIMAVAYWALGRWIDYVNLISAERGEPSEHFEGEP